MQMFPSPFARGLTLCEAQLGTAAVRHSHYCFKSGLLMTTTQINRRSVARGVAWSIPAVTMGAPAAQAAVSPNCTSCTNTSDPGINGTGPYWSNTTPTVWSKDGLVVTFNLQMQSGSAIGTNGQKSTQATGLVAGSQGIGDNNVATGLVLNMKGTTAQPPSQLVTMTFNKPVCNATLVFRDFSWYAGKGRDQLQFSRTPSRVTSSVKGGDPNGAIVGTGAMGDPIMRATQGTEPLNNGYFYDLWVVFYGLTNSISMVYSGTNGDPMYLQLNRLQFCY